MKRKQIIMVAIVCMVLALVTFKTNPVFSQSYDLRWTGVFPPQFAMNWVPAWFAEELEKRTQGRVKITMHYGQTLGKMKDMADMLNKGVAHFALVPCKALSGVFPLHEAEALPYMLPTSSISQEVWYTCLHRGIFDKEFANFKVLWAQPTDPSVWFFRKQRVTKLEDTKGLLLRSGTGMRLKLVEAMGGSPVSLRMSELYLALQKGTVDGITTGPEAAIAGRLSEVAKHCLWLPIGSGFGMVQMMSRDYWNKLPADIQVIIEQLSQEARYRFVEENSKNPKAYGWTNNQIRDHLEKAGFDVYTLNPEEEARWIKLGRDIGNKWVEEKEAKGLPVRKVVEIIKEVNDYYR